MNKVKKRKVEKRITMKRSDKRIIWVLIGICVGLLCNYIMGNRNLLINRISCRNVAKRDKPDISDTIDKFASGEISREAFDAIRESMM
jgi:hypothetical protein